MNDEELVSAPRTEIVRMIDDIPMTASLVISELTRNEHPSVMKLIRANLDDMNEVGMVRFEIRPKPAGQIGGGDIPYALMDEPAASLLMTYLRNTPKVKEFKKRLVAGFYAMRQALVETQPPTNQVALPDNRQLARMVLEEADRADRETAARLEAESRAKVLEAPAAAWEKLADAEGDVDVADAAKILSRDPKIKIGRDRLFSFMAAEGWVFRAGRHKRWKPYQTQVDNGRLTEKFGREYVDDEGEIRIGDPKVCVTAKGVAELHKRLGGSSFVGGGQLSLVVVEDD